MKKLSLTLGCLVVMASLLFVACGKEKTVTIKNFFEVSGATLVEDEMPEATADYDLYVAMNNVVIPGGSSIVNIAAPVSPKKIMVGVKDEYGYYELVPEENEENEYSVILSINQKIDVTNEEGEAEPFTIIVAVLDVHGDISRISENQVTLHQVGTGMLQVSLTFDAPKDIDLHLFEPNGEHIYYGNSWSYNGGNLDLDSNAGCGIDNINNENITYNTDIEDNPAYVEPGVYTCYVDLWENCDESVPAKYFVSAIYNGVVIASYEGEYPVGAPSNYCNIDALEPVFTFVIPDNGQTKTHNFEHATPTQSAIEKMAAERK